MTIEQINGEIRIGGTSVLAQQLIVVPEGKIRLPINKLSDINNDVLNNDQYVAEKLIYPSDISMTNFNLFNTISGQNRLSEPILTNAGEPIPPGKYDLLLSTNIEMPTDSRIFGAFTFNMVMFVSDLLDIVPSMFGLDELSDSPALLERLRIASTEMVPIAQSCLADIEQQESKIEKIDAIYQCLAENSIDVAKVFGKVSGLNIADEAPVLIRDLIYLRGDAWKKISRSFGGMLNFVDSASTVSRIFLLGLYMDDEPWYLGKLSVVDPTQFQSFPIVCSKNPVAMFYDLEFTRCIGTEKLEAKNYSSDWYEVERLFKKEPEEELPIFDSIFGYYRPSTPGLKEGLLSTLIAPGQTVEMSVNVRAQNPLSVRRLRGNPTRTVSVACDHPEREIWGIRITPKCTSSGAYIDLSAKSSQDLLIGLDGGDSFVLEKQPWESENITSDGYITSTSRAVSFQISVLN